MSRALCGSKRGQLEFGATKLCKDLLLLAKPRVSGASIASSMRPIPTFSQMPTHGGHRRKIQSLLSARALKLNGIGPPGRMKKAQTPISKRGEILFPTLSTPTNCGFDPLPRSRSCPLSSSLWSFSRRRGFARLQLCRWTTGPTSATPTLIFERAVSVFCYVANQQQCSLSAFYTLIFSAFGISRTAQAKSNARSYHSYRTEL